MKNKGDYSRVQRNRNRELLYLYRKMRATCRYTSLSDICKEIALTPVSRYYLSEERGLTVYSQHMRIGVMHCSSRYKRRLYEAFVEECGRHKGTRMKDRVRKALDVRAPCVGLSPSRIQTVLTKLGAK